MTSTYLLAAESSAAMQTLIIFLYVGVTVALPFFLGKVIANWLKMKDHGWKIGLILCFTAISCGILARIWDPQKRQFMFLKGVDLQGGVILVYEVDKSVKIIDDNLRKANQAANSDEADTQFSMPALIEALSRRINPSGTKEIVIRPYGQGQVEIIIPDVDQRAVDQIKKVVSTAGVLQFRIVANSRNHQDIIDLAREMAQDPVKKHSRIVYDANGEPLGLWARVAREQNAKRGIRAFKVDVSRYTVRHASTGEVLSIPPDFAASVDNDDDSRRWRLAEYIEEQGIKEIDVLMSVNDKQNVTGAHLGSVMKSKDEFMNPDILFNLKGEGIDLFAELTHQNRPEGENFQSQLGIVLDNELLSAPNIQEEIRQHGRITGRFTEEEVDFLVHILEAGSLPVVLNKNPISESTISPLLGRETIEQGKMAITGAGVLVFLFMLVYYRFSGFLACLALVLNLLFTLSIMVLIKAPLTLPGLAGLVLTVGMSVDANVLIFERMREEVARGTALRMTIRNGFSRATATIIDSNLTTILTAVILYAIGTDQLRGFSVTLILGILTSMFTAIFCTRVAFDIVERHRIMSTLRMFQFIGATNLDFIGKRYLAIGASVIVIVIGMVGAFVRGQDLFDIDFTGGSSVHVTLEQPADPETVRALLDKEFAQRNLPYTLTGMSVMAGQTQSKIFKVDAKLDEVKDLEGIITHAFQNASGDLRLAMYSMSFNDLKTIVLASPPPKPKEGDEKKGPNTGAAGSAEKPISAEKPPAGEKPAAADKPETKSDSKPESKPDATPETKPENSNGASRELPESTLLAFAADAQEAAKKDEAPDAAKKDETAAPTTPAAPATPATATAPAPSPSQETGKSDTAKSDTVKASPAAEPQTQPAEPKSNAFPASKPTTGTATQVEVVLTFHHEINEQTLRGEIDAAAEELKIPLSYFDLLNPDWQPGSSNPFTTWTLRISASKEDTQRILEHLQKRFSTTPVWSSSNKIGPQVAGRMQRTAIMALIASWIGIVIYVWVRFQNLVFGVAAVIALIHDVLVTVAAIAVSKWLAGALGFLLVEDFKISLTIVAALLTIIGYSINDTIVIFDRLREVKGKSPEITVEMMNSTLNLTLSRTILTAFTVFLTVIVLYGFGGQGIHGFAFSMLIGVVSGTYSTVYIASPFVLWLAGKSATSKPKSAAA